MGKNSKSRRAASPALVLAIFVMMTATEGANSLIESDCIGEGGAQLCSAPSITAWGYALCDNAGAYVSRYRAWCEAAGGTYTGLNAGCHGSDQVLSESELLSRAEAFSNALYGRSDCTVSTDTGWGQTIDSYQCWGGAPLYESGILFRDFRFLEAANCGEDFYALRSRKLVCSSGSKEFSLNGRRVCVKEQEFSECNGVGNPVLPLTGKKIQREVDLKSATLPLGRVYSSEPAFIPYNVEGQLPVSRGQFGDYWRTNFSYRLYHLDGTLSTLAITYPNGSVTYYDADLQPVVGVDKGGLLQRAGSDYVVRLDGLTLTFSAEGYLRTYSTRYGRTFRLKYSGLDSSATVQAVTPDGGLSPAELPAGLLVSVEDVLGNTLYRFDYDASGRIVAAKQAEQRLIYKYDDRNNLVEVDRQSGVSRQYLYENSSLPHLLTGIIDESGERLATWQYDDQGRALLSEHEGGRESVALDHTHAQDAIDPHISVINPLGKETTYHYGVYNGVRKIKKVEGHPSNNCVGANRLYDYYDDGTLRSSTDWLGNMTTYVRDLLGREVIRVEAVGTQQERTVSTHYHSVFGLPSKVIEPHKTSQMQYDSAGRLIKMTETVR